MDKAVRQLAVSAGMPVEPQEVVISHPEGKVIISTVITVKAVCWTVGSLVSTVDTFNHLFIRAEFL